MESIGIITVIIALLIIAAIAGVAYFFWMKIPLPHCQIQ